MKSLYQLGVGKSVRLSLRDVTDRLVGGMGFVFACLPADSRNGAYIA